MEKLGWMVERVSSSNHKTRHNIFIRRFPLLGSFIKVLRIKPPVLFAKIEEIAKKYRAYRVQIEPGITISNNPISNEQSPMNNDQLIMTNDQYNKYGYKKAKNSFAPTRSIHINLNPSEKKIVAGFSPEKRRAIRKAVKNKIKVCPSEDINSFIDLKNRQLWPFGFLLSGEIKTLWKVFSPNGQATLLLAFTPPGCETEKPIAGVLLLFHDGVSYYWLASSTALGKKLSAPGLLVWEAIKFSRKRGYKLFDFEGVEDTRFPQTKNWAGFSKFKKGFGGEEIFYDGPIQKLFWPTL